MSDYFPVHAHSAFSVMDGMQTVKMMVDRIESLGLPGWALTDHGTMAGVVQGYKESKKAGLAFFPGSEFYLVRDVHDTDTRAFRWHIGMMALDHKGYEALVKLSTRSWQEDRFYFKPLIDLSDLASLSQEGYADHIAVTTGCYSGMVINGWKGDDPAGHAGSMIQMLRAWFPNTLYVELQNHGIRWPEGHTDGDIADALWQIAQGQGLPVVVGADSHYIHAGEQDVHDLMKDICYFGDGEDLHFNGGPYGIDGWGDMEHLFPDAWHDAISEGHADLLDRHRLKIPALDSYKFRVPAIVPDPDKVLEKAGFDGLTKLGLDTIEYLHRLDTELEVIRKMGMSNYFLLVKTHVSDWCRDNGVIINTRGSANGSLLCYALGITTVDPLKWNTSFDRFLSLDRMKPPDIDVDVDFESRERLITHLKTIFPSAVQIGTYAKIGLGKNKDGEDSGAVLVQYMAAMRKKDPHFNGKVKDEHWDALNRLSDKTTVYKSLGKHAAGIILPGEGLPTSTLPLTRIISSNSLVTQFTKDDVEALGFTKIDVLGLRALQTLNECLRLIGKPLNDWSWIPFDDKLACALLRSGNGVGLFQFEGFSSARGGREVGIRSTRDTIFTLALYRPALMNGGQKDLYLYNRKVKRKDQHRLHPIFDPVLEDTAGVPLYQEQIMEMLKTLGMAYQEYNDLMTAIKASNGFIQGAAETFDRIEPLFYDLCEAKGLDAEDSDDAWNAVVGFTEYGFNRAHSTSYGLMAYYSAYLKAHYPLEYMAALLSVWAEDTDKVKAYTAEARRLGFSIVRADVNHSMQSWTIDPTRPKALRKGLVSLPGIAFPTADVIVAERQLNGSYRSVQDFIDRTPRRPVTGGKEWASKGVLVGVCKALMDAGAFRSVHGN